MAGAAGNDEPTAVHGRPGRGSATLSRRRVRHRALRNRKTAHPGGGERCRLAVPPRFAAPSRVAASSARSSTERCPVTGATVVAYPAPNADRDAAPRPSSPAVTGRLSTDRGSLDRFRWVLSSSPPLRRSVVPCSAYTSGAPLSSPWSAPRSERAAEPDFPCARDRSATGTGGAHRSVPAVMGETGFLVSGPCMVLGAARRRYPGLEAPGGIPKPPAGRRGVVGTKVGTGAIDRPRGGG